EFVWDQCMPDQMYVFNEDQVPHILSTVVANMKPMYTKDQKLAPANVIFLCARFAHYYSTPDLLDSLLNGYIQELTTRLRKYSDDPMLITFWMANTTQLLYYIKKDTSLVTGTVEHQLALSELVHEIYQLFVKGAQNKLHLELNQAILNCETIPGLNDESKFGLKKTSFLFGLVGGDDDDTEEPSNDSGGSSLSLRRTLSLRRKPKTPHAGINGKTKPSPSTITNILGNTLFVLQTYEVHPMLVHHILNQLIYFISCHLFNQILKHKKYCCRSRAMQIRMNITNIEDWIRNHGSSPLVHHLNHHFKPLIQLLQLLQIFSSHTSSQEFIDTLKSLEELNPLQIKRASENYRYETDEPRVPDEVYDYIKVI
ncbi:DIL-domain-containing protein, partial [Conidiobolus coronatus NRRL 28638]